MDKWGGSQTQHISQDEPHLLFISCLWEVNALSLSLSFPSFFERLLHIFLAVSSKHTLGLSSCLNQQYVGSDLWNPPRDKMSENKQARRFSLVLPGWLVLFFFFS